MNKLKSLEGIVKGRGILKKEKVNVETGEVLHEEVKYLQKFVKKEEFARFYTSIYLAFSGKKLSGAAFELMFFLVERYGNGIPFGISKGMKEEVSKETGRSVSSYNRAVRELLDCEILLLEKPNIARSYIINPIYVFNGEEDKRRKLILELNEKR